MRAGEYNRARDHVQRSKLFGYSDCGNGCWYCEITVEWQRWQRHKMDRVLFLRLWSKPTMQVYIWQRSCAFAVNEEHFWLSPTSDQIHNMDKSTGPATEAVWQWKPGVSDISVSVLFNDYHKNVGPTSKLRCAVTALQFRGNKNLFWSTPFFLWVLEVWNCQLWRQSFPYTHTAAVL